MNDDTALRSMLDGFEEAVCVLNHEGVVRCMNAAAEKLTGYREEEALGRALFRLDPAAARENYDDDARDDNAAREGLQWRHISFQRESGEVGRLRCRAHAYQGRDSGRTLLRLRSFAFEADENMALHRIRTTLRAVFDAMPDGLIIIDESGSIQLFSAGAEKLFGYREEEILNQNVKVLMPSPYREAHDGYLAAYRETGVRKIIGIGREVSGLTKGGEVFPMYLSIGEICLGERRFFVGVTHDLTRLKRAEEQLLLISSAMDQCPVAVMICNNEGRIEYVNRYFTTLTGYGADKLVGQSPKLLQSEQTPQSQRQRLWETIAQGREWRGEILDRRKDGATYWAYETITPLCDAEGRITHFVAVQEDITERKRDRETLQESEERFRHVAKMAGEWLWEQDHQGRYIYSSAAVKDILGFSPEEILGQNYIDLFRDVDHMHWSTETLQKSAQSREPFHRVVNQYRHKDGRIIYTESSGAPFFDAEGKLIKWRGVDHDITARKAFEDALRVRERAIESVHVGIVISDARAAGNPNIYVNPELCRMTGYAREELLGHSMNLLQGPETAQEAIDEIHNAITQKRGCEVTLLNYRKDGVAFWNELLISPVLGESGELTHYIGVQTDVTEKRKAEESRHELEMAKHIQLSLLPSAPLVLQHVEFAGVCVPASHVGGDYFDFFQNSDSGDVVIADVSGHSVGAALIMTEMRSALRAEARKMAAHAGGPAQMLHELNELLFDDLSRAELFVTMFYLRFSPDTLTARYANAGHNRVLLSRADERACRFLDADGLVLGVRREIAFEERMVSLSVGDCLLFYTDGIPEAQNSAGEFYGMERLCESFRAHRSLRPPNLVERVLADVRAFCGDSPLRDDIAFVAMHVS